jgi:hypothetical protein
MALALAAPTPASSQDPGSLPLVLAIPESFPDVEGRVVLLREPGRDVVLLRASDATPETLSVALTLRRRLNASTPRRERQGQMLPVTGYARRAPLAAEEHERLSAALSRLEAREATSLGRLGRGRAMTFRDREG